MKITETTFPSRTYLVWRKEIDVKEVDDSAIWKTAFEKVSEYIKAHNLKITGPGVALYFRWDEPKGKGEIGIGNPVEGVTRVDDPDLSLVSVPESKAIMATVHGGYEKFPEYHSSLQHHLQERSVHETLTVEEYVVTGGQKSNPNDWETNLYYLYK